MEWFVCCIAGHADTASRRLRVESIPLTLYLLLMIYFKQMIKGLLVIIAITCSVYGFSQNGFIILKKKKKTLQYYAKDSHITFQLHDGQWLSGIIEHITSDSFYFTQEIIRYYPIGTDTLHFKGLPFALHDVDALPARGHSVVYRNDQVFVTPGRQKLLWLKNGLLFQAAGAGYVGLNIVNDAYRDERIFSSKRVSELGVSAAVFLLGTILRLRFDPYLRIGNRYRLESVVF
jgi:hypothetical protein